MEKLKKYSTFLAMKDHHVGKTGKWMKNLLTGKKDREKQSGNSSNLTIPTNGSGNGHRLTTANKEEQRWSFRGLSTASPRRWDSNSVVVDSATTPPVMDHHNDHMANDSKKHTLAVVAATEAAVAAAKAAAAVIQLTAAAPRRGSAVEEASAIKIQSVFRAYLARKALKALKGLVKLQALVRGHLVRKQATARLRYMQAPMTVRARIRLLEMAEKTNATAQSQFTPTTSTQGNKLRNLNQDFDEGIEENTETMEIDIRNHEPLTKARNSHTNHTQFDTAEHTSISTKSASIKKKQQQISPATSSMTDTSPRRCSNHFKKHSFNTAPKSPDLSRLRFSYPRSEYGESPNNEHTSYPNYMANTKSSKAKVRCHSAPKQRPAETNDRQPSRQRPSLQGTNVSNAVRMQRSLANVRSTPQNYKYSWFVTLNQG